MESSTELYVNKLNESITYEEGRIYWEWNKSHTSKLWKRLSTLGYRMISYKGGTVDIKDNEGNAIISGEIGRVNALHALSKVMA